MLKRGAITCAMLLAARVMAAQRLVPPPYAEYRLDAIDGHGTTVQPGLGYTVPMGIYVRVAAIGGIGPQWRDAKTMVAGRTDVIVRFLLDPFRQTPVGLSLGGGISVPYEQNTVTRPYLTAVVDVEGRAHEKITPAVQIGLGGGVRVGLALRTSMLQRR